MAHTAGRKIKTYIFTGILVTAPVAITFYLAVELFTYIDKNVTALIPARYNPRKLFALWVAGLGCVAAVAVSDFGGYADG